MVTMVMARSTARARRPQSGEPRSTRTVLRAGTVIAGDQIQPIRDGVVVIEDGTIAAVGPDRGETAADVDLGDLTLAPGLIHAHALVVANRVITVTGGHGHHARRGRARHVRDPARARLTGPARERGRLSGAQPDVPMAGPVVVGAAPGATVSGSSLPSSPPKAAPKRFTISGRPMTRPARITIAAPRRPSAIHRA